MEGTLFRPNYIKLTLTVLTRNACRFADICKRIFLNEIIRISIKISLNLAPYGSVATACAERATIHYKTTDDLFQWRIYPMMTSSNGNIFRVTGHLCGKFTGPRWISHTKASDAELWCFLWFTPE